MYITDFLCLVELRFTCYIRLLSSYPQHRHLSLSHASNPSHLIDNPHNQLPFPISPQRWQQESQLPFLFLTVEKLREVPKRSPIKPEIFHSKEKDIPSIEELL